MTPRIVLMGGQGYPLTETPQGLPALKARLVAHGVEVLLVSHADRQPVRDWLYGHPGFRGLIGDSLGAGAAAIYPGDLDGEVDFVGGFQPSAWDPVGKGPLTDRVIMVAHNVKVAHCIWNPVWIETGGLGSAHYVIALDSKTQLTTTEHHGFHPDDWGYSQDLMFTHVMSLIGGSGKMSWMRRIINAMGWST